MIEVHENITASQQAGLREAALKLAVKSLYRQSNNGWFDDNRCLQLAESYYKFMTKTHP